MKSNPTSWRYSRMSVADLGSSLRALDGVSLSYSAPQITKKTSATIGAKQPYLRGLESFTLNQDGFENSSANRSAVHPTKSETCPSPISTMRRVPSFRRATSIEKNGELIRAAASKTKLGITVARSAAWG